MFWKPLLALILLPSLLFADEGTWASAFGYKGMFSREVPSPEVNYSLWQIKLTSSYDKRLSDHLKFKAALLYVTDPLNRSAVERNSLDLPEFNLKWKTPDALTKIGTDIYNWGVTDGYNPVDLLNTRNYFDPIHSRKLGAFSISVNYAADWMELDLVYIPIARESQLPGTSSRWLPREVYVSQSSGQTTKLLLPADLAYQFDVRQSTDSALTDNYGLRTQFHLEQLELALYGYDGVAQLPLITPVVSGSVVQFAPIMIIQVNPDVVLRTQSYRQRTAGFSFVKSISTAQVKGVTSWTQPTPNLSTQLNWSHESVLAIETPAEISADANFVTVLQYSNIRRPTSSGNDLSSISRFFDSNVMLGSNLIWRDTDTYTFFYAYDLLKYSSLLEFSYEHKLTDALKMNFGISSIDGPNDSPIGVYSKNKSATFGMSSVF